MMPTMRNRSDSPRKTRRWAALLLLLAAIGGLWRLGAEHGALPRLVAQDRSNAADASLEFIRVRAPQSKLHALASSHPPGYYMPMKRKAFENALAKIRNKQSTTSAARIDAAIYTARFRRGNGKAYLEGSGEWQVRLSADWNSDAEAMLPLGNCGIAIKGPLWKTEPPTRAELGLDDQERLVLAVAESGTAAFGWSLRGAADDQAIGFPLQLPKAASRKLFVALPQNLVPQLTSGVALDVTDQLDTVAEDSDLAKAAEALSIRSGERLWRFELSGLENVRLLLRDGVPQRAPRSTFRRQTVYRLGLGGVELQVDLQFDDELPSELLLAISPDLRLDARIGNSVIPLEIAGPQQLLLRLPSERAETSIRLQGVAELPLDKLWTLPQIYVENETWREGEQRILISDQLRLQRLAASECRQFDRRRQADGREEVRFREEADTAAVQVQLSQRQRQLESRSGIAIRWDDTQLTAISSSEFSTTWGDIFSLELQAPQGWQLDSLETDPPDALDVEQLQLQPQQGKIVVPLARAVSPKQPVRVKLFAHRPAPANNAPVNGRALLVGRPLNTANIGYLAFQGEQVREATLVGVAPNAAGVSDLIEPLAGATVVQDDSGIAELAIRKPPLRPEYRVEIGMTGTPSASHMEQRYQVRCIPDSSAINRIRIQSSEPLPPLRWTIAGEESVTVAPLDDAQTGPPAPDAIDSSEPTAEKGGRRWDLILARPLDEPFVLEASFEQPWPSSESDSPDAAADLVLGLLSVPEAISQRGTVRIENTTPVIIEAPALERLPLDNGGSRRLATLQAAFRYEPATPMRLQVRPLTADAGDGVLDPATAQVWSMHHHTRFEANGSGSHSVDILMSNQGLSDLLVALPANARPLRLLVDQQPQTLTMRNQRVRVRLPGEKRQVAVQLAFRSAGDRLGWRGELRAPLLTLSVPVLERRWTFDLPPGFDLAPNEVPYTGYRSWTQWRRQLMLPFADEAAASDAAMRWRRRLLSLHNSPDIETWGQLLAAAERLGRQGEPLWIHGDSLAALRITPASTLQPDAQDLSEYGLDVYDFDGRVCLTDVCRQPRGFGEHALPDLVSSSAWSTTVAHHQWLLELPGDDRLNRTRLRRSQAITVEDLDRRAAVVQVRRLSVVRALMLCLMLITAGVVHRSTRATTLCWWAAGWLAAWLMPTPWSWCGAAVGWGACLATLIQLVAPPWTRLANAPRVWSRALAAFAIFLCASLIAQTPEAPEANALHRVLMPIDDEGQPAGENVSVPLPIWKVLDAADRDVQLSSVAWLLTDANYELYADNPGDDNPLTMTTSYRLRVLRQGAEVRLRMNRADGPVVTAVLDGIETNTRWNAAGDHLMVATNLPGVYDLSVTRIISPEPDGEVAVAVPTLPTASIAFGAVDVLRQAKLATAVGVEVRSAGRVTADLGPTPRLSLLWEAMSAQMGAEQVEEHLWLQVRRVNSVVVRSMFRFQSNQPLGPLQLFADKRLRLIKLELDGEEVAPAQIEETAAADGVVMTLDAAEQRTAEVVGEFHFKGVSGVGRIQPPRLYARTDGAVRRWFAVSTEEDGLQAEFSGNVAPMDVDQFSVSWPAAEGVMQAGRIEDDDFELVMRYAQPAPTVAQVTRLKISRQRTVVQFEATLSNLGSATFQHLFAIPPGLQINSVRVLREGVEAPHHYEVDNADNLSIFLDRPAGPEQWLELRGVLRGPARRLPRIKPLSATVVSEQIEVCRNFDVAQVEIQQPSNLAIDSTRAGEFERNSRFVATLTPESDKFNCRFRPLINRRRATADSTTILRRKDGQWVAEFRGRVAVSNGVVDALRVRITEDLQPRIVSPANMQLLPGVTDPRDWRIIPDQPVDDAVEFVLEAPIAPGEDGVLRAPDIAFQGLPGRRFIALPSDVDGQPVRWATPRGLQAVEPSIGALDGQPLDLFEVVDRRFAASLRRTERVSGSPLVLLADVQVRDEGGENHGTVTFDLEPGGRRTVAVDTREHCELVSVRVNGVRAPALERGAGIWLVSLGPHDLPQRVVIDYRSPWDAEKFWAPTLVGIDTARTMWTVSGSRAKRVSMPFVSDIQQTLWRIETIATLLSSAADIAASRPLEDIRVWHRPWAVRWFEQQRRLDRMTLTQGEQERAKSFDEMRSLVAEQLRVADQLPTLSSASKQRTPQAIRDATQRRHETRHVSIQGASHQLPLSPQTPSSRSSAVAGWLASSLAFIGIAFWVNRSQRRVPLNADVAEAPRTLDRPAPHAGNAMLVFVGLAVLFAHPLPWPGLALLATALVKVIGSQRALARTRRQL